MSRIPFWRIIVFGRHGIVLSGQAEPRQIMLNRNSVKLNSTFLRIQEEPPPMVGGHKKVISYFLRNGVASVTPLPVSAVLPRG